MSLPAVFLDRDGTLIEDVNYLSRPDGIRWLPGVLDNLKILQNAGYLLVIITNQSGIGRGYFTEKEYEEVTAVLKAQASSSDVTFSGIYHCPHWPDQDGPCECRKPGKKLFETAVCELDIDCAQSMAIGDRERDVIPAQKCGVSRTFIVEANTGIGEMMKELDG